MTEKEELMYRILGKISASNAPLVFKGALITKLILAEGGYTELKRYTKDIDANWVSAPPSMGDIVETINQSLGDMQNQFHAVAFREYGEKMSAGIYICDKVTDDEVVSMDIDMRPIAGSRIYQYGKVQIKGVLLNEILADKITVLSKKVLFRRAKDIVDVYALAHCVKIKTTEVFEMFRQNPSREVGAFDEFCTRREDLEHAYGKLAGINGKPPFDDVYSYLEKFLQPFIQRDETSKLWNTAYLMWEDTP